MKWGISKLTLRGTQTKLISPSASRGFLIIAPKIIHNFNEFWTIRPCMISCFPGNSFLTLRVKVVHLLLGGGAYWCKRNVPIPSNFCMRVWFAVVCFLFSVPVIKVLFEHPNVEGGVQTKCWFNAWWLKENICVVNCPQFGGHCFLGAGQNTHVFFQQRAR